MQGKLHAGFIFPDVGNDIFNQDQAELNEIKINENNEKYIQRCLKYMNLVWSFYKNE